METRLQEALSYVRLGWHVLPLHNIVDGRCSCGNENCSSPGKHPLIPNGSKGAVINEATVKSWWSKTPLANVGIATGNKSGLIVLDVDSGHGGEESFQDLLYDHGGFPDTVEVLTGGGGFHYYFKYPGNGYLVKNKAGLFPGIDVRGDGGYVVAPPSNHISGGDYLFEASSSPEDKTLSPVPSWLLDIVCDVPTHQLEQKPVTPIPEGQRNDTLFRMACSMRRQGMEEETIVSTLLVMNRSCQPPLGEKEVRQIAQSTGRYEPAAKLVQFSKSDRGNAQRMSFLFGDWIRYCAELGKWYIWDGVKWAQDRSLRICRCAREVIDQMYMAGMELDGTERVEYMRYVTGVESLGRTRAMIDYASSEKAIAITKDKLDQDPLLLNTKSGTVDLRTGSLKKHDPKDLITKSVGYPFDESAGCPRFTQFLGEIIGDKELIDFLQLAVGWSLTGIQREQKMLILHGVGNNGKTTLVNTLLKLLGDYSCETPVQSLLVKRYEGIPNDIARLEGMRFVTAMESGKYRRLNESLIKQLTGGDPISARFLHHEYFQFVPTFKIWFMTNHVPQINEVGIAMWRRLIRIPFDKQIPEVKRDIDLGHKLEMELPGILNWAIEGCLKWQKDGLVIPKRIKDSTMELRKDMDILAGFLSSCCEINKQCESRAMKLYEAYRTWCENTGEKPVSERKLGLELRERGFCKRHSNKGSVWQGIGLLSGS